MGRNCRRSVRFLCGVAVLLVATAVRVAADDVTLQPEDRVLILAPHPDDEVIGCGGVIQRAAAMGLPIRVVFLTYGDNNEWSFLVYRKRPVLWPGSVRKMGTVRHDEALSAAQALGLSTNDVTFLGYPDFGTLNIWRQNWGKSPPLRAMLTRVTAVPYKTALRPGAPYKGEDILRDVTAILREFRPTKIFVSHPADHNGDHRALYLFTRVALWDLAGEIAPEIYPYLIHFKRWPRPRGPHPELPLTPPRMLQETVNWRSYRLTDAQIERKGAALKAHRTQYKYSRKYLLSFVRPNELFGDYPPIALTPATTREMAPVTPGGDPPESRMPEELTEQERALFVGLEWRTVRLENDQLVVAFAISRPLAEGVQVSVHAFGYRADRPFAEMPKLHIKLGEFTHAAFDQRRRLDRDTTTDTREPRLITIRIPLQEMAWPQRVFISARTYLEDVPLDWVAWRIVELPANR